jgi:probable F420-dependent oxidoreductase
VSDVSLGMIAPFADGMITSGAFLTDFAGTLEDLGVESLWTVEHVVVAEEYEPRYPYSPDGRMPSAAGTVPMPDPLDLLAFVAAGTTALRLGTAVVVAPLHSAAVLAKRAATVDRLSGGRLLLGLGIGWQREEYDAVGAPFRDRGRRLEECVGAMRALWHDAPASFHGVHVSFERVHSLPQPAGGRIPILLGGHSDAAVTRAGRIADGWFPFTIGPGELGRQADLLRATAAAAGRDPAAIDITAWPGSHDPAAELDPAYVRRYVDAGARRLVLRPRLADPGDLPRLREQVERYRQDVLARL